MPDFPVRTVLLIGETGCGKSFVGNRLLGREEFLSSASFDSCTKKCAKHCVKDGELQTEFQVIDTVGFSDTTKSDQEVRQLLGEFANLAPAGIHAVVVVLNLQAGGRSNALKVLDTIENFFGKYVWAHSVVLCNMSQRTAQEIMKDLDASSGSPAKWAKEWRAAGVPICAMPTVGRVDKSIAARVVDLKRAIVNRQGVYQSGEFRREHDRLKTLTTEAINEFTTCSWRDEMTKVNKRLLDGRLTQAGWEIERTRLGAKDAEDQRRNDTLKRVAAAGLVSTACGAGVGAAGALIAGEASVTMSAGAAAAGGIAEGWFGKVAGWFGRNSKKAGA